MSYEQRNREDARLAILAELAQQRDGSLNSRSIARMIEAVVPRKPVEWVEMQLNWLESMGAVNLTASDIPGLGRVVVAVLTRMGRDHVERRVLIAGVSAPVDPE